MKIYKTANCSQIIYFFQVFIFFLCLFVFCTVTQHSHNKIMVLLQNSQQNVNISSFSVDTFIFWFLKPETCRCISFPLPIEAHKRLLTHTNTSQHFLRKIYTYKICYKLAHKKYTRFCSVKSSLRFLLVTTLDSIYKAR